MLCYKDQSYCADQDQCNTYYCSRKLSQYDLLNAKNLVLPIAWMSFKETCGKFEEIEE